MRNWLKTGLLAGILALAISIFVFSSFNFNIFYDMLGNPVRGIRIFYGLIFVSISFFTGIIVGVLGEGKSKDRIDYLSKIFVIFFNSIAFFLVLGFGFSLQVWKVSLNNTYTLLSIFGFISFGSIVMLLLYVIFRKKIVPKKNKSL